MPKILWERTRKQAEAWSYLCDDITTELLFGGGAGGAKSYLGCGWIILMCLKYPGTRWVIARNVLKRLKETTLATFFEVCSHWGIKSSVHFKFNSIEGTITFKNGSVILLKELYSNPSDPEFDALGSLEITGAFVDEANQISEKAINVLKSRIRYKLDIYKIIPKLLCSCNPAKNWVYSEFYKPSKDGTLKPYQKFVQALATDNPFISRHYIENLRKLDKNSQERLLYGNWEYDDDPAKLFEYDSILDLFTNKVEPSDEKYISCDVARMGADKTVIAVWYGLKCVEVKSYDKTKTTEVVDLLEAACAKHGVRRSHVVIDEDGVGGGVVDNYEGCVGFVNNSTQIGSGNYANLKTQCYFEFARLSNEGKIRVENISVEDKELLIGELEQVKQKDVDKDGKIRLVGKEMVKEVLGRSPDISDSLMMRMYFEIQPDLALESYFV